MQILIGVEPVEHVELGERELGEAVDAHRLAQHHAVEPAGAAATAGDGAELPADVDQRVAVGVEQLGRERAGADAGGVRLGDADDPVDVARPDAGADAGAAGGRVRRRDVRDRCRGRGRGTSPARLRAARARPRSSASCSRLDGVGDERRQPGAELAERGHDLVDVERVAARLLDERVLGDGAFAHERREASRVEHVADAQPDAAGLVGVGRADALQRGADLVVAAHRLGDRVVRLVPREDQVGVARHLQPAHEMPRASSVSISLNSVGRSTTTPLAITGITWSYRMPDGTSCRA